MLYELKNVIREFKGRVVLNLPQLEIKAGQIYALIGPNGAGKTTLLNMLAFLDKPDSGVLIFEGEPVVFSTRHLQALRRRAVLVDQYPILFTGPVWKNVEFGLKVRGVPEAERRSRVLEMLDLVGMQRFLEADAHKLSGGETKRIALARALAVRPEVLLCDEPGANVDRENQESILSILEKVNKTENTSIIFSTHYLAQGRRLADHTLMLEHGMLSDMVNENIFRAEVINRTNDRVACLVVGGLQLSLPESLVPAGVDTFKLLIDPDAVIYEPGEDARQNGTPLSGHVIHISQDRGRVRIGLDLGLRLYFFLSMAEYLKKPPVIGGKVTIALPDSSLRCSLQ